MTKKFTLALAWMLVCFSAQAQIVLQEGFESGIPATWSVFDNGVGLTSSWTVDTDANTGTQAAYVEYEYAGSPCEDWLVTPAFTPTASASEMTFFHKQSFGSDYGTQYYIKVSTTSATSTASFTDVKTYSEADFGTTYTQDTVDLSAYVGQSIYVAFVMVQDDGDDWFIDDVQVGQPSCQAPTTLATANITTTSADFSWTLAGTGAAEVQIQPKGTVANAASILVGAAATYNFAGLSPNTEYTAFVRENCGGNAPLQISAVYDGPLSGGTPKGVELYVNEDIADLSAFGLGSANNGGGSDGEEFTFPAVAVTAGSYIYVTNDTVQFLAYTGFSADYQSGAMSINGDDAVELFMMGSVIDVYGDINVDGNGETWEYLDGWAVRNNNAIANYGTFNDANWTYSGPNAVDGCTSNATCASQMPFGTFTTTHEVSAWAQIDFTTACLAVQTAPWTDSFEVSSTLNCYGLFNSGSFSWAYTDNGTTPSSGTGPSVANSGNSYMFTEATGASAGDTTALYSPSVDITTLASPEFEFYYHMHGADMGNLYVFLVTNNNGTFLLDSIVGQQQTTQADAWAVKRYDLAGLSDTVQVIFLATRGNDFTSDIAIDDISFQEKTIFPSDVAVTAIQNLNQYICNDSTATIGVVVENLSGNTELNVPVNVNVNGTMFMDTLAMMMPNDNDTLFFTIDLDTTGSATVVNAYTTFGLDTFVSNDTMMLTAQAVMLSASATTDANSSACTMDGMVSATATGAISTVSYVWSTGDSVNMVDGLGAGTYVVTVTDSLSTCMVMDSTVVTQAPNTFVAIVDSTMNVACKGDSTGSAMISAMSGTMPYTYAWSNNDSTAMLTGVAAGTYTAVVTDSVGCMDTVSVTITEPATAVSVSVVDNNDGTATATAMGGMMPYTYVWSNANTSAIATNLMSGVTYSVVATDSMGCTATDSVSVLIISVTSIEEVSTLNVYPNPTTADVNVAIELAEMGDLNVDVIAVDGRVVIAQNFTAVKDAQFTLATANLSAGVYSIRFTVAGKVMTQRLVIQK